MDKLLKESLPATYLGRDSNAHSFTKILLNHKTAKVISIEAGFGYGKTMFQQKWAEDLKDKEHKTVIQFDAWRSDHSNDPLIAFVAALMEHLPEADRDTQAAVDRRKQGLAAIVKVAKVGLVTSARLVGGHFAGNLVEGLVDDSSEEQGLEHEIATAAGSEVSKAATALLVDQLMAERVHNNELHDQLENLYKALTASKSKSECKDSESECKDHVIIIIDELDRCRPDYAIGLLEAIKHLFDHPRFKFVLMINPDRLEATANVLFGNPAQDDERRTEPYFTKFIDLRLRLQQPDYEELVKRYMEDIKPLYEPLRPADTPYFDPEGMVKGASVVLREHQLSPREVAQLFDYIKMAMILADNQKIDLRRLLQLTSIKIAHNHLRPALNEDNMEGFCITNIFASKCEDVARKIWNMERNSLTDLDKIVKHLNRHRILNKFISTENLISIANFKNSEFINLMETITSDVHQQIIDAAVNITVDDTFRDAKNQTTESAGG